MRDTKAIPAARRPQLHEAIPATTSIALLVNPTSPSLSEAAIKDAETATRRLGLILNVLHASTEREFDMDDAEPGTSGSGVVERNLRILGLYHEAA